jgi:hypothetical protein
MSHALFEPQIARAALQREIALHSDIAAPISPEFSNNCELINGICDTAARRCCWCYTTAGNRQFGTFDATPTGGGNQKIRPGPFVVTAARGRDDVVIRNYSPRETQCDTGSLRRG